MRFVIVLILGVAFYAVGRVAADNLGIPLWGVAGLTLIVGIVCQLMYAHFVNAFFDAAEVPKELRVRLRNDAEAGVPIWIAAIGFVARASFLAGLVLPILKAVGLLR